MSSAADGSWRFAPARDFSTPHQSADWFRAFCFRQLQSSGAGFPPHKFGLTRNFMIHITLPDGSKREYPGPVTVAEVAASIGSGLAKAAWPARSTARWWTPAL
jgi:hypothetical protein